MEFSAVNEWKTYIEKMHWDIKTPLGTITIENFLFTVPKMYVESFIHFFFNLRSYVQETMSLSEIVSKTLTLTHIKDALVDVPSGRQRRRPWLWAMAPQGRSAEHCSMCKNARCVCWLLPAGGKCPSWTAGPPLFLGPQTIFFLWRLCSKVY